MNLLCLAGSPRKGGNSDLLLDAFASGAVEAGVGIEKVCIADLDISPCMGCGGCAKTGKCVIDDDMTRLYPKLLSSSSILVSTPVYFMGPSAQLKVVIDRCQAIWAGRLIAGDKGSKERHGFVIAVSAQDNKRAFQCTLSIVRAFFVTLGLGCEAELCYPGLEERGAVLKHHEMLDESERTAYDRFRTG